MSACPVTIHALLHIADSIKICGPVWCYWAFPMERYCNRLKPAIKNQRFPYACINWYALEDAQLTQIKAIYNIADELSLRPQQQDLQSGARVYQDPSCELYILTPLRARSDLLKTQRAYSCALAWSSNRVQAAHQCHYRQASQNQSFRHFQHGSNFKFRLSGNISKVQRSRSGERSDA